MKGAAVLFASGKDDWQTPPDLFAKLDAEFGFDVDVAADFGTSLCPYFFNAGSDTLAADWSTAFARFLHRPPVCWCNPPYSRGLQPRFIAKAATERRKGVTTVMLLPARTDTKAFHGHIWNRYEHGPKDGVEVRFLAGRVRFVGAAAGAPFPSMVVVFRGAV